jgi:hypothetical protein
MRTRMAVGTASLAIAGVIVSLCACLANSLDPRAASAGRRRSFAGGSSRFQRGVQARDCGEHNGSIVTESVADINESIPRMTGPVNLDIESVRMTLVAERLAAVWR